ncbi:hypothetical protein AB0230_06995 [Microbacterium sp. NPDC089190]|uniref:hypothetical protein n=1 Tax=Microbacterium sp. NPDC089190 TaxID=3155063 RepID=UPI00344F4CEF
MLTLADAASDVDGGGFSLVPWIPLLVAFVVAATTLGTAWWNTRGESAALRQLKAMNEALTGLPQAGEVRKRFEEARDRLAQRIADSDSKPPAWRRYGIPVLIVVAVIGPLVYAWLLGGRQDAAAPAGGIDQWLPIVVAGTAAGVAVSAAFDSRLRRKK